MTNADSGTRLRTLGTHDRMCTVPGSLLVTYQHSPDPSLFLSPLTLGEGRDLKKWNFFSWQVILKGNQSPLYNWGVAKLTISPVSLF